MGAATVGGAAVVAGGGVKVRVAASVGVGVSVMKRVGGGVMDGISVAGVNSLNVGWKLGSVGVGVLVLPAGEGICVLDVAPSAGVNVGCKPGRGVGVGLGAASHNPPPMR